MAMNDRDMPPPRVAAWIVAAVLTLGGLVAMATLFVREAARPTTDEALEAPDPRATTGPATEPTLRSQDQNQDQNKDRRKKQW